MVNGYDYVKNALHPSDRGTASEACCCIPPCRRLAPAVHIGLNSDRRLAGRSEAAQQVSWQNFILIARSTQRVVRLNKVEEATHEAFRITEGGPAGLAYIDIPFDLTAEERTVAPRAATKPAGLLRGFERRCSCSGCTARRCKQPRVPRRWWRHSLPRQRSAAETGGNGRVSVVTTSTGVGVFSETHALAMGSASLRFAERAEEETRAIGP